MMERLLSLSALVLVGCTGDVGYSGMNMNPFFPFDGSEREWEYMNEDTTISYKQISTLNTEYEEIDNGATRIYDIATERKCMTDDETCTDAPLFTVRMSSNGSNGAQIHGYTTPALGEVQFGTPLSLAAGKMDGGDTVESIGVDGHDWVATFERIEECEIPWTSEWDECVKIRLESTPEGHWMAGTYWAVSGYNIVARQLTGDTGRWELSWAKWEP